MVIIQVNGNYPAYFIFTIKYFMDFLHYINFSFPYKFFSDSSNNINKPLQLYNPIRKLNNWCPLFFYSRHFLISYRSLRRVKVSFAFFVHDSMCIVVVFVHLILGSHVVRFMGVAFVITRRNNLLLNLMHLASEIALPHSTMI